MSHQTLQMLVLCGAFFLAACATKHPQAEKHRQWTANEVNGLTMSLVDPVRIERMQFTPDGLAPVSFGFRRGNLTSVCAPLYYWKLVSGRLRIFTYSGVTYEEFTLISRDATTVTVRRHNGKVAKYKILPK